MTEEDKQTAENVLNASEYIKAANSFGKYAYKEWVEGNLDERAMLLCCVDRTTPDGTGMMNISAGDRDLLGVAVMEMMKDERLASVFHNARIANETVDDMTDNIKTIRKQLRSYYGLAAVAALWTLCVIGFQLWGVADLITTISSLLLMVFVFLNVGREIMERRRMLKRLQAMVLRDCREKIEHHARNFFEALKKHMEQDDDE